ncbi:rhomboid family intramembrane serine protease [Pseudooceanicola sp. HF7]|uniref:rhomboid family intramembrane serine protease n=1 Tax=Pseudooceanicola sp. HF7 TaxID=2721560 RepID=UPI001431B739|nr:rhomboid family intramembrane serine protease [Pseudooceanicola sp. HF7]NIZ08879.1 rhomboid family intramembrane serine protease [Pseudooceanicola sp. HF7]
MQDPNMSRPEGPVNAVPPAVVVLFIAIVAVEGLFSLGKAGFIGGPASIGWRLGALQDYGFFPAYLDFMLQSGSFPLDGVMRFVTYPFVHGAFTQAVIAGIMLLALGKFVGEAMKPVAILVLFFGTSILAALVFGLIAPPQEALFGAFPAVYGFIGAYSYMLWIFYRVAGERQIMAFRLIGLLMGIQLLFAVFFDVGLTWVAELAGFVTGFALAPLLLPGGLARLRAKVQRR